VEEDIVRTSRGWQSKLGKQEKKSFDVFISEARLASGLPSHSEKQVLHSYGIPNGSWVQAHYLDFSPFINKWFTCFHWSLPVDSNGPSPSLMATTITEDLSPADAKLKGEVISHIGKVCFLDNA
jgi:hypothetical protein